MREPENSAHPGSSARSPFSFRGLDRVGTAAHQSRICSTHGRMPFPFHVSVMHMTSQKRDGTSKLPEHRKILVPWQDLLAPTPTNRAFHLTTSRRRPDTLTEINQAFRHGSHYFGLPKASSSRHRGAARTSVTVRSAPEWLKMQRCCCGDAASRSTEFDLVGREERFPLPPACPL